MKLADWQKKQIEPSIHDMLAGRHNNLNVIYDAVEKACSGGMHTNGPDRIGQAIRREVNFVALKHGDTMSVEQRGELCRAIRKLFADFCPQERPASAARGTVMAAGATRKSMPRIGASNCAIREYTGDGVSVGRCWHYVKDGVCPRHGDVRAVQDHYARTGELTAERKR